MATSVPSEESEESEAVEGAGFSSPAGSTFRPGVVDAPDWDSGVVDSPDAALEPGATGSPRTGSRAAAAASGDGGPFSGGRATVGSSAAGRTCAAPLGRWPAVGPESGLRGYWRQSFSSLGESLLAGAAATAALAAKAPDMTTAMAVAQSEPDLVMDPFRDPRRRSAE